MYLYAPRRAPRTSSGCLRCILPGAALGPVGRAYPILSYTILSYTILSYPILYYTTLHYTII